MTSFLVALTLAAAINPSGHWEGTLDTPQASIPFQVDFAQTDGALVGALSIPMQHLKALPLTKIVVDGNAVTFGARSDQLLSAIVAEDGKTMAGTFTADAFSLPFTLTRTGEAAIEPPPASPRIGKDLEGTWQASLGDGGVEAHVLLTMRNDPDGKARGEIVNLDEGGLRLPIAIAQTAAGVIIETRAVASTFAGVLNGAGELVGTYHQGALEIPVTFRKADSR